jgi:tetratricopeptide (TPR) repeat protein
VGLIAHRLRLCVSIVILARSFGAVAQPPADREAELLEAIAREETQNGLQSEALLDSWSELALLYQNRGDEAFAIAAIERARHIVRATKGLYSLEQAPLLRQLIDVSESVGDAAAAWENDQELLTLARRHPDDLRTVQILRESAERRMAFLGRYLAGEAPPEIELGCYGGWPRMPRDGSSIANAGTGCRAHTRSDVVRAVSAETQRIYAEAIAVLVGRTAYASDELRDLEMGLLRSIDVIRTWRYANNSRAVSLGDVPPEIEPWRSWLEAMGALARLQVPNPSGLTLKPGDVELKGGVDYLLARESLVRLYAYELAADASLARQVEAFVRIADWDLLHSQNTVALREYEQLHQLLEQRGDRAALDQIFAPPVPVTLPALPFHPNPLMTAMSEEHIDIEFEINRFGKSSRIKVFDATANATDADKNNVVAVIRANHFRPRVTEGELARAARVVVRYYLSE